MSGALPVPVAAARAASCGAPPVTEDEAVRLQALLRGQAFTARRSTGNCAAACRVRLWATRLTGLHGVRPPPAEVSTVLPRLCASPSCRRRRRGVCVGVSQVQSAAVCQRFSRVTDPDTPLAHVIQSSYGPLQVRTSLAAQCLFFRSKSEYLRMCSD